jgi:hypothetical protein
VPVVARIISPHRRPASRFSRNRPMYGPTNRGSTLRSSRRKG